jgi:hypothetical protein
MGRIFVQRNRTIGEKTRKIQPSNEVKRTSVTEQLGLNFASAKKASRAGQYDTEVNQDLSGLKEAR